MRPFSEVCPSLHGTLRPYAAHYVPTPYECFASSRVITPKPAYNAKTIVWRSGGSSGACAITTAVPRRRTKRETRNISTVILPAVLDLDSLSFLATPLFNTSSSFSLDLDLNLDLCSGLEIDIKLQDITYSEGRSDVDPNSDGELDVESDSKADVIIGTIAYYTKQDSRKRILEEVLLQALETDRTVSSGPAAQMRPRSRRQEAAAQVYSGIDLSAPPLERSYYYMAKSPY
ncbi:hypothetical protein BU23DRAFT_574018 [Bimuria novae-zelandiae CBS 107.79]|uniref:Uncharacterized protein n=1 Tax=Bimuria novae-zelandiae CBS 107.79 TaxID=1447943 RepID=A0A6A5UU04_9PLEO|nr:hypothetical protein BU23DRAFT_574018 [Bimuria novae-zelandiae CBS 107.79]